MAGQTRSNVVTTCEDSYKEACGWRQIPTASTRALLLRVRGGICIGNGAFTGVAVAGKEGLECTETESMDDDAVGAISSQTRSNVVTAGKDSYKEVCNDADPGSEAGEAKARITRRSWSARRPSRRTTMLRGAIAGQTSSNVETTCKDSYKEVCDVDVDPGSEAHEPLFYECVEMFARRCCLS